MFVLKPLSNKYWIIQSGYSVDDCNTNCDKMYSSKYYFHKENIFHTVTNFLFRLGYKLQLEILENMFG